MDQPGIEPKSATSTRDRMSDGGVTAGTADRQRDLVFNFCRDYAEENGYTIKGNDELPQNPTRIQDGFQDYEDVTGEKQYISGEELSEMESVIYSISFGK